MQLRQCIKQPLLVPVDAVKLPGRHHFVHCFFTALCPWVSVTVDLCKQFTIFPNQPEIIAEAVKSDGSDLILCNLYRFTNTIA